MSPAGGGDDQRGPVPFPDPRTLLRRHGLSAKKSWGQNFLIAESVYRALVDAVVRADDDWVVEIGAGLGTLTMRLCQRVPEGKVIAVERDPDLVAVLEAELGHLDNVEIHPRDALHYDLAAIARWRGGPVALCGNLPYQIASPLLFRFLDARQHWTRMVVMLQREMAERIMAPPGTAAYGALGVMLRTWADVDLVVRARATAFAPPPRVDSAVLCFVPLAGGAPRVPIDDPAHYSDVVHAAFGQRRKTLRNALRARFDPDAVDAALAASGIDGQRRGETLSIEEMAGLAAALPAPPRGNGANGHAGGGGRGGGGRGGGGRGGREGGRWRSRRWRRRGCLSCPRSRPSGGPWRLPSGTASPACGPAACRCVSIARSIGAVSLARPAARSSARCAGAASTCSSI